MFRYEHPANSFNRCNEPLIDRRRDAAYLGWHKVDAD